MDERYSIYLDQKPTREDFYMGNIKGYILDSMVADEDLYQFEKTCDYFSYEDILSESKVLRPLLQVYQERELNGLDIRITNRNHKKDIFKARGFYVLKEYSDIISVFIDEYEEIFQQSQTEVLEAIKFYRAAEKFTIHRGDFVFFDVNSKEEQAIDWEKYKQQQQEISSQANIYKAQSELRRAASMMMMSPGSAPMSAGNSAILGGVLAGTTGAVIGAATGMEKQLEHNQYVNNYNTMKSSLLTGADNLSQKARELEKSMHNGNYPYKTVIAGDFFFGIRTLFGIIPAMYNFGYDKIRVGLRKLNTAEKPSEDFETVSIVSIENDEIHGERWANISKYIETGNLIINTSNSTAKAVELLKQGLKYGEYDEVLEKGQILLKLDPHNADVMFLMALAEKHLNSAQEAIENRFNIITSKYGFDILEYGSDELIEKLRDIDSKIEINIEKENTKKKNDDREIAIKLYNTATTIEDYKLAKKRLASFKDEEDIADLILQCDNRTAELEKKSRYNDALAEIKCKDIDIIQKGISTLEKDFQGWEDSEKRILEGKQNIKKIKSGKNIIRLLVLFTIGIIVFINIRKRILVPNQMLADAITLINSGEYTSAYLMLDGLNYKNSNEIQESIKPQYYKELLTNPEVGKSVFFGTYEQDDNIENGSEDIEWVVLAKADDHILVVSKYILDQKAYNEQKKDVTWESCSLRKWLNKDFMNIAFSDDERALIACVEVSADKNPNYSTDPGNDTADQIFLLSLSQVNKFLSNDISAQWKYKDISTSWLLRTPGYDSNQVMVVKKSAGSESVEYKYGIRPAMWIEYGKIVE